MAREFCVTCRAESAMAVYRRITFMGGVWAITDEADEADEEHY